MSDPQDRAEALDDDKLTEEYPPEEPLGVESRGVTEDEERSPEGLDERVAREVPEQATDEDGEVVQPLHEADEDLLDREAQAVAEAEPRPRDPEADAMPEPAEEAALHLEDGS